MVDDWVIKTMYATKRRRRNCKTMKPPLKSMAKTNPSKRHRERLNSELDNVSALLPFDHNIITKLDKLSILRLSVSYLRIKSYFQALDRQRYIPDAQKYLRPQSPINAMKTVHPSFSEGESILQANINTRSSVPLKLSLHSIGLDDAHAINGFVFIVTCDGEVFFASESVEEYLGFHQSDIIHQSVLELIHSQDREEFTSQLKWKSLLRENPDVSISQLLADDNDILKRSFTARFRCLLDNTSGFITLEITGRIAPLYGQHIPGQITEQNPLALFAVCSPFGPLPLLEAPSQGYSFKSKHKLDLSPIVLDQNGKLLLGYHDNDLGQQRGYSLIHPLDVEYIMGAHQELLKTGSAGMVAYRMLLKDGGYVWLQTGARLVYKNSKPDCIFCTNRQLAEEEGVSLVTKRSVEFKLPYPLLETDIMDDPTFTSTTDNKTTTKTKKRQKHNTTVNESHTETVTTPSPKKRRYPSCRDMINDLAYYYYPSLGTYGLNYQNPDVWCSYECNGYGGECDIYGANAYSNRAAALKLSPSSAFTSQQAAYAPNQQPNEMKQYVGGYAAYTTPETFDPQSAATMRKISQHLFDPDACHLAGTMGSTPSATAVSLPSFGGLDNVSKNGAAQTSVIRCASQLTGDAMSICPPELDWSNMANAVGHNSQNPGALAQCGPPAIGTAFPSVTQYSNPTPYTNEPRRSPNSANGVQVSVVKSPNWSQTSAYTPIHDLWQQYSQHSQSAAAAAAAAKSAGMLYDTSTCFVEFPRC